MKAVIGVIGVGMVGGAISECVRANSDLGLRQYDKFKDLGELSSLVADADIAFVSVPTLNCTDGEQDLLPLTEVLSRLDKLNFSNPVVIKCTVVPGTMNILAKAHPFLSLVHCPEFLTERNANQDFMNQKEILFSTPNATTAEITRAFLKLMLPGAPIMYCSDFKTTELAKYIHNCLLATKVAFLNEMHNYAQMIGADYSGAVGCAVNQGVIGASHCQVPGPDGKFGFGGSCFPKDTEALAFVGAGRLPILDAVIESNRKQRNK